MKTLTATLAVCAFALHTQMPSVDGVRLGRTRMNAEGAAAPNRKRKMSEAERLRRPASPSFATPHFQVDTTVETVRTRYAAPAVHGTMQQVASA